MKKRKTIKNYNSSTQFAITQNLNNSHDAQM